VPELLSSDEYPAYPEALPEVFGAEQVPPRTGKPGRPAGPRVVPPAGIAYGTAHKARAKGLLPSVRAELRRLAEALSGRFRVVLPASFWMHSGGLLAPSHTSCRDARRGGQRTRGFPEQPHARPDRRGGPGGEPPQRGRTRG